MRLKECIYIGPSYRCEFTEECNYGQIDTNLCAYGFTKQLGEEYLRILKQDANQEGYSVFGIEAHLCALNEVDSVMDVFEKGHRASSWAKLRKTNGNIIPFSFENKPHTPYNLRCSESGCYLGRIISKLDKGKFPFFKENLLSKIGNTIHNLSDNQHVENYVHNQTLKEIGVEPTNRKHYCEKEVQDKLFGVTLRGHPDAVFQFQDSEEVGVIDFKRSKYRAYEKKDHRNQLLLYNLLILQELNLNQDYLYLITIKRPFQTRPLNHRKPAYHVTKVANDFNENIIKNLEQEITESFEKQAELLEDKTAVLANKSVNEIYNNGCFKKNIGLPCFDKDSGICDFLIKLVKEKNVTLREVIEEENLVLPDVELPK